jgi:alpha-glucosidase
MSSLHWFPNIFIVVVVFFSLRSSQVVLEEEESTVVGYGYVVRSVGVDSNRQVLTAKLDLIKPSSVYAPDIKSLNLHVRSL